MKKLFFSLICLTAVSGTMSFVTWQLVGAPDRSVACEQADLPEHFVCLDTIKEWRDEDVLWVDARPRADWERNGVEGSVLLNDQEEWLDLEPMFMMTMMTMMAESRSKIVVYCNQSGCGSSKYVADQLRGRHAETLGFKVYVLEGGVKALLTGAGELTELRGSN